MKKLLLLILILISGCNDPFSEITTNHDSNDWDNIKPPSIIFDCPEDYNKIELVDCLEYSMPVYPKNQDVDFILNYYVSRGDICGCENLEGQLVSDLNACKQAEVPILCYECKETIEVGWQCLKEGVE